MRNRPMVVEKKTVLRCAAILLIAVFSTSNVAFSSREKEFVATFPVHNEYKISYIQQFFEGIDSIIEKKLGVPVKIQEYPYSYLDEPVAGILDLMNEGKTDFAMIYPVEYHYYLMDHKTNAIPIFVLEMNGNKYAKMCLYTRKEDNITDIKQLKGKTWGGARTRNVRYLLYKEEIDDPVDEYFGKMVFITDSQPKLHVESLLKKEIDVFTLPDVNIKLFLGGNKKDMEKIRVSGCEEYLNSWLFVVRKDVPVEIREKAKDIFLNLHDDPDFGQFRYSLRVIKGKFTEVTVSDIYDAMKSAVAYKNHGWLKEEMDFLKANYKPEEPPK